jgi:hypothetical protein
VGCRLAADLPGGVERCYYASTNNSSGGTVLVYVDTNLVTTTLRAKHCTCQGSSHQAVVNELFHFRIQFHHRDLQPAECRGPLALHPQRIGLRGESFSV